MTTPPIPDLQLGRLDTGGSRWTLTFERRIQHPPARVWQAITEPDQLAAWFPTLVEGIWTPGTPLTFRFAAGQAPDFSGTVIAVEPPRVLEFDWGPDRLRFALQPSADQSCCTLILTVALGELGKAARDAAGWHICLDALTRHLDGRATGPGPDTGQPLTWTQANDRYIDRFGPAAATIGPPAGM